jgi:flavin-dependent dehydrogenase
MGLVCAYWLARYGIPVIVFERLPDLPRISTAP